MQSLRLPLLALTVAFATAWSAHAATNFYPGVIKREYFGDIAGTAITALTGSQKFIQNLPDEVDFLTQLESPDYNPARDNYGGRMSGLIVPTETGSYRFYLSGDDQTELYLSTDSNPANKQLIAREPAWNGTRDFAEGNQDGGNRPDGGRPGCADGDPATDCENESDPIQLTAGQRYYFEVLWKEGGGGDHASVTWVRDGEQVVNGQDPIQADQLGVETSDTTAILGGPFASRTYMYVGDRVTLNASLYLPPGGTGDIEWFKNGVAIPDSGSGSIDYIATAADGNTNLNFTVRVGEVESDPVTVQVIAPEPEVLSPGFVKAEFFRDIMGTDVFSLVSDQKFLDNQPDETLVRNSLSSPEEYGDNYGVRVTGFILPQETGEYRFFIRSDDASQFFLNQTPNGPTPDPFADFPIAEEFACCNPFAEPEEGTTRTSEPIMLTAGERYAFLFLVKEGTGGDYGYVAWRREGDTTPAASLPTLAGPVIGGTVQAAGFSVAITQQPQLPGGPIVEGRSATLRAAAEASPDPNFIWYQWQLNGQDIPGANSPVYEIPATLAAGSYTYRLVAGTVGDRRAMSDELVVNVVPDTFPPVPKAGVLRHGGELAIGISFDEEVEEADVAQQSNYSVSPGTISSFRIVPGSNRPEIKVSGVEEGETVTVTVMNVRDLKGNAIPASGASVEVQLETDFAWVAIGGDEANVRSGTTNYPDDAIRLGEGDFDLVSGGSAYWANYDEATFVYEEITGDFDRRVRVEYQDPTSQWARAGLQVREALDEGVTPAELFRPETDPDPNPDGVKMAQNFTIRVNPVQGAFDPNTGVAITGNNAYELVHRPRAGYAYDPATHNAIFAIQDAFAGIPAYPNAWMRLQRQGQVINAYRSDDGENWIGPASVTYQDDPDTPEDERLADTVYVGVFYAPEYFNNAIVVEGGPNILETSAVAKFRDYGPVGEAPGGDVGPLTIGVSGGNIEISWPAGQTATLQSAPAVTGPWTPVAGATNPYSTAPSGTAMFFRLAQ